MRRLIIILTLAVLVFGCAGAQKPVSSGNNLNPVFVEQEEEPGVADHEFERHVTKEELEKGFWFVWDAVHLEMGDVRAERA